MRELTRNEIKEQLKSHFIETISISIDTLLEAGEYPAFSTAIDAISELGLSEAKLAEIERSSGKLTDQLHKAMFKQLSTLYD